MLGFKEFIRPLLEGITYTDVHGDTRNVNVYSESDIINGKIRMVTPALVIRRVEGYSSPAVISWKLYNYREIISVSLYLSKRAKFYDPFEVKQEILDNMEAVVKANANGSGSVMYVKINSFMELDYLEKPNAGLSRVDIEIEGFGREV